MQILSNVRCATALIEYHTVLFEVSDILACANAVATRVTCFQFVTKRNAFAVIRFKENMIVAPSSKNDPDDKRRILTVNTKTTLTYWGLSESIRLVRTDYSQTFKIFMNKH